jgi:hypothetical protein
VAVGDRPAGDYLSYLLRLWRVHSPDSSDEAPVWRASLEDAGTGERVGFASLDDLLAYLHRQTDAEEEAGRR